MIYEEENNMARQPNIYGGGAQTNINGLCFEQKTSLNELLETHGFEVINCEVKKDNKLIGMSVPKRNIYNKFLNLRGIDYKNYNSKGWEPDEAFINLLNDTVYIIEKKFQKCAGSVDEKLPNCHFKKLEYEKLFTPINFKVEFVYILSDWFKDSQYRDTLMYIKMMGCHYYFNTLPVNFLGLNI